MSWGSRSSSLCAGIAVTTLCLPVVADAATRYLDVEYGIVEGASLRLDVSVPDLPGPFPVVIVVHGGGWTYGDKAHQYVPPTRALTAAGFTWFSINYRLAPDHRLAAQMADVRASIRWVMRNAAAYKGDPGRIAVMGYSAGAHLAALVAATAHEDTRIQALVLLAGPMDLLAVAESHGRLTPALQNLLGLGPVLDENARRQLQDASPVRHLNAEMPPVLLLHGTRDESVEFAQSEEFERRVRDLGVPCELMTVAGAPHDIAQWRTFDEGYEDRIVSWLQARLVDVELQSP